MMFNYQDFDEVFAFDPRCSYDEIAIQGIEANRKALQGLFIEKVLKLLGIKRPTKFYPSKSNSDLRSLHKAIIESNGDEHHKISILFYILLDFDAPTGRRNYSTKFERFSFLPQKYSIYMKGLWHLDRLEFEMALQYLTHPCLIPTFPDEILEVLVGHAKNNDLSLPLAYYHTVQPSLTNPQALESLFSAIARTSVTEAFFFGRGQPEHARQHMFKMLVALVLNNSSKDTIADRSVELVNLPFTHEEEAWFEEYLQHGEGRLIRKAKDTLMMRRIGTGNFSESLSIRHMNGRAIGGLDWQVLTESVQDGMGPRIGV